MPATRTLRLLALALPLAGCSPAQEAAWWDWWDRDPEAAVAWVYEHCGELCTDDWDRDGVVEPDSASSAGDASSDGSENWTDVTTDGDTWGPPEAWGQCSEWMDDALAAGWTEEQWGTLNWIMAAESGCDPGATSSAGAQGLLQVMPLHVGNTCGSGNLYDPWFNLACGLAVYRAQGWTAWDVY